MPRRRKEFLENGRIGKEKPQQRNAANARERARMRILSRAFSRLKTTLPWVPADTKLSKLDTLRLATSYIAHLRTLLCEDATAIKTPTPHPIALTWPFNFNKSSDVRENANQGTNQCDPYSQFNQHSSMYPHPVAHNHHNHSQNNNPTIDRYYGEELPDYEYYSSDMFQM